MPKMPTLLAFTLALPALLAMQDAVAVEPTQRLPIATSAIENQGRIESLDPVQGRLTVNGTTYRLHENFEVVRHTAEGVLRLDPRRLSRDTRVGVEEQDGVVRRLHVLE